MVCVFAILFGVFFLASSLDVWIFGSYLSCFFFRL